MANALPALTKIRGALSEFRVIKEGWGIGRLTADDEKTHPFPINIAGTIVGVRVGDAVEMHGVWIDGEKYGRQFKVKQCVAVRVEGVDGAVKWMTSRLPWVGETRAKLLVQRFGAGLWNIIENEHARLCEVEGITIERAVRIRETYNTHVNERDSVITLRGWGLTDGQITRCQAKWGALPAIITTLRQDPYLLSYEIQGFGFVRADEVARAMGVARDAPERISAGVQHVLNEASSNNGHCYMAGAMLQNVAAKLLGVEAALVGKGILAAASNARVIRAGWRIYTPKMIRAEQACADALRKLIDRKTVTP